MPSTDSTCVGLGNIAICVDCVSMVAGLIHLGLAGLPGRGSSFRELLYRSFSYTISQNIAPVTSELTRSKGFYFSVHGPTIEQRPRLVHQNLGVYKVWRA